MTLAGVGWILYSMACCHYLRSFVIHFMSFDLPTSAFANSHGFLCFSSSVCSLHLDCLALLYTHSYIIRHSHHMYSLALSFLLHAISNFFYTQSFSWFIHAFSFMQINITHPTEHVYLIT